MILKLKENEYSIFFDNGISKTYRLLTNISNDELDLAKLATVFLNLKDDIVIARAFNSYGKSLPNMNGIYSDKDKVDREPYLFDKFHNVLLIMREELEKKEDYDIEI